MHWIRPERHPVQLQEQAHDAAHGILAHRKISVTKMIKQMLGPNICQDMLSNDFKYQDEFLSVLIF